MRFRDPSVFLHAPRHHDTPTWMSMLGAVLLLACFVATYAVFG